MKGKTDFMSQKGYIYLISNPLLKKGIYKIGISKYDPVKRVKELSRSTSIPTDFILEYVKKTNNIYTAEIRIHLVLDTYRCSPNKEFFAIQKKHAIEMIDKIVQHNNLKYDFGNNINIHNDFLDARYSLKLTLIGRKLLIILMAASQHNSLNDQAINQIFQYSHFINGFLGQSHIMGQLNISKNYSQKILKNFVYQYKDLAYQLPDQTNFEKIFDFIKYYKGEIGWKFTTNFNTLFYNETLPIISES
jgi:hypothetical protein